MVRSSFSRRLVGLVLLLAFATPWTAAAAPAPEDLFFRLRSWLGAQWVKAGCIIDPSGACAGSPASGGEAGCSADPSGRCNASQTPSATDPTEAGCRADPNGGPCAENP